MEEHGLFHQHGIREVSAKRAAEQEDGFACLTSLVAELKLNWDLFDAEERSEMTQILAPWKEDLFDPNWDHHGPPPPNSPCWSYQYDNVLESDRF